MPCAITLAPIFNNGCPLGPLFEESAVTAMSLDTERRPSMSLLIQSGAVCCHARARERQIHVGDMWAKTARKRLEVKQEIGSANFPYVEFGVYTPSWALRRSSSSGPVVIGACVWVLDSHQPAVSGISFPFKCCWYRALSACRLLVHLRLWGKEARAAAKSGGPNLTPSAG